MRNLWSGGTHRLHNLAQAYLLHWRNMVLYCFVHEDWGAILNGAVLFLLLKEVARQIKAFAVPSARHINMPLGNSDNHLVAK